MSRKDFMEAWTTSSPSMDGGKITYIMGCTLRMGKAQYPFHSRYFKSLKMICDLAKEDNVYQGDIIYGGQGEWRAILQIRHITPTRVIYILDPLGESRKVEDDKRISVLLAMIEFEGPGSAVVLEHIKDMYHGRDVIPGETDPTSEDDSLP